MCSRPDESRWRGQARNFGPTPGSRRFIWADRGRRANFPLEARGPADYDRPMKVIEFAFVYYPVSDIPKAREFYEKAIGLKPASVWGDDTQGWFEYEVGPHTLAISNFFGDAKAPGPG